MKKLFLFNVLMDSISIRSHKTSVMTKNNNIQESVIIKQKNDHAIDEETAMKDNIIQRRDIPPLTKVQWQTWLQNHLLEMKIASEQLKFISGLNSDKQIFKLSELKKPISH